MAILKLLLLHAGWLGTGLAFLEILPSAARFSVRRLLEAYFTGAALNVVILYAWAAVAPVPIEAARALIGGGVAMGLAWLLFHRRSISFGNAFATARPGVIDLVLSAQLAPPMLLIFLSSWSVPVLHWDPLAIWTNKAGLLFHGEFLRSEAFVDPYWLQPHPGYPIGYPLVLFEHSAAAGWMDELMMNRGLVLLLGAALALLVVLMSEWAGRRVAMVALGLLLWTPAVYRPGLAGAASSGYADLPVGLAAALAAGLFARGFATRDKHSLTAAAATLILALSFKNEGLVWAVLICALGLIAVALRREWRRASIWFALAAPLVALVLLRMAHLHLSTTSDVTVPSISDLVGLLALTPRLAVLIFERLIANPTWGVLRFCLPVVFVIGMVRARREPLALLGLAAPIYLVVALAALGLTEVQRGAMEYFSLSMFPRLIMQLLPSAVLFSVILNSPGFVNTQSEGHSCYGDPSRRPRARPNPDAEPISMIQTEEKCQ